MTNAEMIKAIRENEECNDCAISIHGDCNERKMMFAAAYALEAAEQRIAELSLDNKMLKNTIDADKGVMLDRIRFLEAQFPKEGEWIEHKNADIVNGCLVPNYECSACHDWNDNKKDYCPNCGARMKGEQE